MHLPLLLAVMGPVICLCGPTNAAGVETRGRELVAGIPALGQAREVQWWELRWAGGRVEDVVVSEVDGSDPELAEALGSWAGLSFRGRAPALTCRTDPWLQLLICYEATDPSTPFNNHTKGCCADSLVIYPRASPARVVVPFLSELRQALATDGVDKKDAMTAFGTHTLAISRTPSGALQVLANVHYNSTAEISGHFADAAVLFELTGAGESFNISVVPTAAGRMSFVHHRDLGTFSTAPEDGIYHLQYLHEPEVAVMWDEQWHGNGVLRFRDQRGAPLFAFTQRQASQMVILSDPWEVSSIEILQRFGTPTVYDPYGRNVSWHSFGVEAGEGHLWGGVHNVFYMLYPDGRETMTLFCNSQGQDGEAKVYEFDLRLVPEASVQALTDDVFATNYTRVALGFSALAMGGARPLSSGLYIAASGLAAFEGLELADAHGHLLQLQYTAEPGTATFYDPFTFIKLPLASDRLDNNSKTESSALKRLTLTVGRLSVASSAAAYTVPLAVLVSVLGVVQLCRRCHAGLVAPDQGGFYQPLASVAGSQALPAAARGMPCSSC